VKGVFFIVGPTAAGKSEIAADVACEVRAEIVSADAFQIYEDFNLLTAKPDAATLLKAPHHLIGTMSIMETMSAEKFRVMALSVIKEIHARGKLAVVVGGSGLYIKALTHGLSPAPAVDRKLREELNALALDELGARLSELDPAAADKIDMKNRRRVVRALEICLASGRSATEQRDWKMNGHGSSNGVFVFRERDDLHERINRRVAEMFKEDVLNEVSSAGEMSATAAKMIGLGEIREVLKGKMSILQCIAEIQQATRQYAKRQLTWFRHQTSFEPLNLSLLSHGEAVKRISQCARRAIATQG
jgi:tRNA dimethylallyltransferase